jgi:hypothetical protein
MAMDFKALAKAAGITENELKGLSTKDQIKLITKKMNEEKQNIEVEQAGIYISNYEKKLPKIKDTLDQPIEIYVKKIGQKKTPTPVSIIGYNASKDEFVAFFNEKLYSLPDDDLVKSMDELMNLVNNKKPKGTAGKKTGTKK